MVKFPPDFLNNVLWWLVGLNEVAKDMEFKQRFEGKKEPGMKRQREVKCHQSTGGECAKAWGESTFDICGTKRNSVQLKHNSQKPDLQLKKK